MKVHKLALEKLLGFLSIYEIKTKQKHMHYVSKLISMGRILMFHIQIFWGGFKGFPFRFNTIFNMFL